MLNINFQHINLINTSPLVAYVLIAPSVLTNKNRGTNYISKTGISSTFTALK